MTKKILVTAIISVMCSIASAGVTDDLVGIWHANATTGDMGNPTSASGSLAGAGWTSYWLSLNADSTFSATGANPYDLTEYGGDGDGIVNYSGTYTIDTTKSPMWIDLTCMASDLLVFFPPDTAKQPLQNGIFVLSSDGSELTIQYGAEKAFGIPRPTEFTASATLIKQQVLELMTGVWYADATTGNLGNTTPASGSLAGAGWASYQLTLNADGTFSATGANAYDLIAYGGDEDGIVNYSGTYTIDITKSPMWIDLTCAASDLSVFFPTDSVKQPLQNGVFVLHSDAKELIIQYGAEKAFGVPRPTEFLVDSLGNYDCGTLVREILSIEPKLARPSDFRLSQNYPNPFNPVTHIMYRLPERTHVALTVFNVVGQKVVTLVDEIQLEGNYTVPWQPVGLSSGVYFIRLEAGNYTEIRKSLLLR